MLDHLILMALGVALGLLFINYGRDGLDALSVLLWGAS